MVLKDRLQLGNMWQGDHLSRKRTPQKFARARRAFLALPFSPVSFSLSLSLSFALLASSLGARREMSHYV